MPDRKLIHRFTFAALVAIVLGAGIFLFAGSTYFSGGALIALVGMFAMPLVLVALLVMLVMAFFRPR